MLHFSHHFLRFVLLPVSWHGWIDMRKIVKKMALQKCIVDRCNKTKHQISLIRRLKLLRKYEKGYLSQAHGKRLKLLCKN